MIYVCFLNNHKLNLRRIKKTILFLQQFYIFFCFAGSFLRNLRNRHIESFKMTQKTPESSGVLFFFKQFNTSSTGRS